MFNKVQSVFESEKAFDYIRNQSLDLRYEFYCRYIFEKYLKVEKEKIESILEIGCGDGKWLNFSMKYFNAKSGVGVDLSDKLISYAKNNYGSNNLVFLQENILEVEIKQKFDLIYNFAVVQYFNINEFEKLIEKSKKMLNQNGYIICMFIPNREKFWVAQASRGVFAPVKQIVKYPKHIVNYLTKRQGLWNWYDLKDMEKIAKKLSLKVWFEPYSFFDYRFDVIFQKGHLDEF